MARNFGAATLLATVALAGCNSGDGFVAPSYETFDSTASVTSDLSTVALRAGTDNSTVVTQGIGTLTHDTGAISVNDGTYAFSDPDGPNIFGNYTDTNNSTLSRRNQNLDTTGYQYVTGYAQTYTVNGVTYESQGIAGVSTRPGDVPTQGTATYTGIGYATVDPTTGATVTLSEGTSNVRADFGAGTVDATLNNFVTVRDAAGNTVTAPLDSLIASGMAISGNTFSGGQIIALDGNNLPVSLTGAATSATATGGFYGYDAGIRAPDEVAGIIYIVGPNGEISGGFVAD